MSDEMLLAGVFTIGVFIGSLLTTIGRNGASSFFEPFRPDQSQDHDDHDVAESSSYSANR